MQDLAQLTRQVVDVCLNIRKEENVWIHSWDHTIDLASEIALACQQRGARPFITLASENYWMRSLLEIPKEILEVLPANQAAALQHTDAFIFMLGPRHPIEWDKIPDEKRELADVWYSDSNKYLRSWRRPAQKHSVRMLGIEYCLVTEERAHALGLEYAQWRKVMFAGCLVDQREISEKAKRLASIMQKGHDVSVQTPFGTNLKFKLAGRKPISSDSIVNSEDAAQGIVKYLPSGCVEVAPDEDSAEGKVVYGVPIPLRGRKKIEGLVLEFKSGKVVDYYAKVGIELFENYLNLGQGDVDKFGFFGIGLNPGLKHGFTQDDKVLGGATIGIGGNEDKMGNNRTAENRHWWASMTKATVQIDKEPILKNGKEIFF